ncbi:hypothetical protein [Streptomyces cyslabdanicus]|uniref:hypothetical protein n=1 Tax=Streptomyces cyslabdanicus TaxID=1470456 RepID=UPI004044C574
MTFDLASLARRPITATDSSALAELLNAIEAVDVLGEYYSEVDTTDQINAPLLDLERGTVGVFDGDRMVGRLLLRAHKPLAEEVHRVVVSGGVQPSSSQSGTRPSSTAGAGARRPRSSGARSSAGRPSAGPSASCGATRTAAWPSACC